MTGRKLTTHSQKNAAGNRGSRTSRTKGERGKYKRHFFIGSCTPVSLFVHIIVPRTDSSCFHTTRVYSCTKHGSDMHMRTVYVNDVRRATVARRTTTVLNNTRLASCLLDSSTRAQPCTDSSQFFLRRFLRGRIFFNDPEIQLKNWPIYLLKMHTFFLNEILRIESNVLQISIFKYFK